MKKFQIFIIFSLVITLPITIFFIIWLNNTFTTYFTFDHYKKPFTIEKGTRLYNIGMYEFIDLKQKLQSKLFHQKVGDVNLYLPHSSLNKLTNNLPKSGGNAVKATMFIDQDIILGKTRFRGDNYFHWLLPNKSWRFKTKKNSLYNKVRKHNFIIAKSDGLIGNHMSYKLAKKLSLLAPTSKMINLNVNNSSNGIKIMVEQIDESFLRNNRRMPNDIYKGDNMGTKFNLGISVPTMFTKASLWDKASYNNHYPKNNKIPLDTLFYDISLDKHKLLDQDSFVNFMLYMDLTSSYHHDAQHNWILYYDNYYEKFYPIIWDSMGWQPSWMAKKSIHITHSSELFKSLYRNYNFVKKKYQRLLSFSKNDKKEFLLTLNQEVDKVTQKVKQSKHTFTVTGQYRDTQKTLTALNALKKRIIQRISFIENELLGDVNTSDYLYAHIPNGIRLSIDGNKMINAIELQAKSLDNLGKAYISYFHNDTLIKNEIPYTINNEKSLIIFSTTLLAKTNEIFGKPFPGSTSIEFTNATYDITFDNIPSVDNVKFHIFNKKRQKININKTEHIVTTTFKKQINIVDSNSNIKEEVWSGIKKFSGLNIIHNNILIKPGTTIVLDKNTTLKVFGKVTAIGSKEEPILFKAKDKTKPWNAFALKDAQANGSTFKYCIFKDGSGEKGDLYEYTAMFSVHNVKKLLVENCEFYDSHKTDDMVHVIYSEATFKNTKFIRSLSDALDVDISNLIVDNCEFIDSGNDSIDLMTTNAVVTNTKFTNSKDKGISIGEGSNLLAINNHIKGSEIGMQSKDTSKAYIYNTSFIANKKAIDAYHKNWRYSKGGSIYLDKCIFENNTYNATVGKKSKVIINNSQIDTINNFDKKSLKKHKIIISNTDREIVKFNNEFFKTHINKLIHGDIMYSFFVAGHTYTKKKLGLYPPFINKFENINHIEKLKFGVFTGDIVWLGLEKYWNKVDENLQTLDVPIYFASGNHDIKNIKGRFDKKQRELFISRYGKNNNSYYSFTMNNDLMIILDPNIDKWNISGEQLNFLEKTLKESDNYHNIFVFFHQALWWSQNNKYKNVPINSKEDRDKTINFWSKIEPLFHNLKNEVYLFSGDTGAFQHHIPYYDQYDNIHFIASGMGGGITDNYTEVHIYKDKMVEINLIGLQNDLKKDISSYQLNNKSENK